MQVKTTVIFSEKDIKDMLIARATGTVKPLAGESATVEISCDRESRKDAEITAVVSFNGGKVKATA